MQLIQPKVHISSATTLPRRPARLRGLALLSQAPSCSSGAFPSTGRLATKGGWVVAVGATVIAGAAGVVSAGEEGVQRSRHGAGGGQQGQQRGLCRAQQGIHRIAGSGPEGTRTLDLINAIDALSQLSYRPRRRKG